MNEHYEIVLDLVRRMRQAQRDYFANRTPDRLNTSKRLEREVDRAIEQSGQPVQAPLVSEVTP